jgi:hypothetical protein
VVQDGHKRETLHNNNKAKRTGGGTHLGEHLSSKFKVLSSNHSTDKKKKKKERKEKNMSLKRGVIWVFN